MKRCQSERAHRNLGRGAFRLEVRRAVLSGPLTLPTPEARMKMEERTL